MQFHHVVWNGHNSTKECRWERKGKMPFRQVVHIFYIIEVKLAE
jgi:hypothetical protein